VLYLRTLGGGDLGVGYLRKRDILVYNLRSSSKTRSKRVKGLYYMQEAPFLASRVSLSFQYRSP
jgi:hypothetical protein